MSRYPSSLGVEYIVMLMRDNKRIAQRIADEVGTNEVQAELLPEEKVATIEDLVERHENVAMVGAGTDVAFDTADVVLMSDDLSKIPYVLGLGRKPRRTLIINLAIAFGAIALMIATILLRGIPLPFVVVGQDGSAVLVSLNGLGLLGFHE
jgi:Cd2+/Zn2+-exporting ATPase